MLAIIGGSGLPKLANLETVRREVVRTPYGDPSGALTFGMLGEQQTVFLARHGYGHTIPPHLINYRANMWALRKAGVTQIIAIASVGSIREELPPGALVIPHQIIDYTWGRASTFFEGGDDDGVRHIDFTEPYSADARARILAAAQAAGVDVHDGAVYATTQGPRLETAAEIKRLAGDGADVVGMTGMPEAGLARELELSYAAINVVSNYAAGLASSAHSVSLDAIEAVLSDTMGRVRKLLEKL